jgi:hypothetical protein
VNPLFEAAIEVEDECARRQWRHCFIALAVLRWGEPRLTRDVDLTIVAGFGEETPVIDGLLERFRPRLENARRFALENRVILLRATNGTPIDVALGALPFEERATERATPFEIGDGHTIRTCSAEDLVVMKVFAGRPQDWIDVEGIVARRGEALDAALVWRELRPLLDVVADPDREARLRTVLREE